MKGIGKFSKLRAKMEIAKIVAKMEFPKWQNISREQRKKAALNPINELKMREF
jgi:hypothetical protein